MKFVSTKNDLLITEQDEGLLIAQNNKTFFIKFSTCVFPAPRPVQHHRKDWLAAAPRIVTGKGAVACAADAEKNMR